MFSLCNISFTWIYLYFVDAILTFSKPVFYVYENDGPAQPELTLNVPAIVNFTVQIQSSNVDLSGGLFSV